MYLRSAENDYELATLKRGINQQRSTKRTTKGRKRRKKRSIKKSKVYNIFIRNSFSRKPIHNHKSKPLVLRSAAGESLKGLEEEKRKDDCILTIFYK